MHRQNAAASPRHRALVMRRFLSPVASTLVALALVSGSLAVGLTVTPTQSADAATPAPTTTLAFDPAKNDDKDSILAGENAVYTLTITNPTTTTPWYNIGARVSVPNGITFVSGGTLGTPVIYASGATISDANSGTGTTTVPAGQQVWVWEDVSDLPATAVYSADITVKPEQNTKAVDTVQATGAYFPVGSTVAPVADSFASDNARLDPVFSGSTGLRSAAALTATHASADATPATPTPIVAVHIYKDEPSPESELMRGVHDRDTVYTLTVKNTTEGDTSPVTVTDYLPAGLEFLGCGTVDNSSPGTEYSTAGRLDATTTDLTTNCLTPTTVETVERTSANHSDFPSSMGATDAANGVYTKVTWTIASLAAGSTTKIVYAAGIPLFKNVMWPAGSTPDTTAPALAQVANLDNNTGASTRQSDDDPGANAYTDGDVYTNYATTAGTYHGITKTAAAKTTGAADHAEEIVYSMDLRVLKYVDSSPTNASTPSAQNDSFRTGYLAKYRLDYLASEYTDVSAVAFTDVIPNGLCPVLEGYPTSIIKTGTQNIPQLDGSVKHITGAAASDYPTECKVNAPVYNDGGWTNHDVSGDGTVTGVAYDASTGDFYLSFAGNDESHSDADRSITYPVLMRPEYTDNGSIVGSTSSQDSLTNKVIYNATSTNRPVVQSVWASGAGTQPNTVQNIADDSSATLVSDPATISKKVLPATHAVGTSGDKCDYSTSDYVHSATPVGGFKLGDTVCFELTVNFQKDVDTRNPVVTDMLPAGIDYDGAASKLSGTSQSLLAGTDAPVVDGSRLTFKPATSTDGAGADEDYFVPLGSTLVIHVWGTVTTLSADQAPANFDKPENLMKFQQENVDGDLFFLRDQQAIAVTNGLSLVKGVEKVNGTHTLSGTSGCVGTSPDCDHVQINEGDAVTYRVDVTGAPFDTTKIHVWDALPVGVTASMVTMISGGTPTDTEPAGYDGPAGRSVVVFDAFDLAAGASKTLEYTVAYPGQLASGTSYTNTASIIDYTVENNDNSTSVYLPTGSLGTDTGTNVPGTHTTDDSDVYVNPASITKSVTATGITGTNNSATGQVTHGETVSYTISATVPAHTTVKNAVLSDLGNLYLSSSNDGKNASSSHAYTLVSADFDVHGATGAFTQDPTTGALTFPAVYDNTSADAQTFDVTLTVYSTFAWVNAAKLWNHATFVHDGSTLDSYASVAYVIPKPTVAKKVSPTTPTTPGDTLTYTITVTDPNPYSTSYNTVVTDCIPAALTGYSFVSQTAGTGTITGPSTGVTGCTGSSLSWAVGTVAPNTTKTLVYTMTLGASAAAGATYTNTAAITGQALETTPTDATRQLTVTGNTASATVTVPGATIDKSVVPTTAAVGDSVKYTVATTLPANLNFYTPTLKDVVPSGIVVTPGSFTTTIKTGTDAAVPLAQTTPCAVASSTITCGFADLATDPQNRVVTLTYNATVQGSAAVRSADLVNTATFGWRTAAGAGAGTAKTISDTATVHVTEPVLSIVKRVDTKDANTTATDVKVSPGDTLNYSIDVTNSSATDVSTAYGVTVVDTLPAGVVSPSNFSVTPDSVVGSTITWTLSSLAASTTTTLTFDAKLAASGTFPTVFSSAATTNTAEVTAAYSTSTSTDPRRSYTVAPDPAIVQPVFPHVTVAKSVTTTDQAKVGDPFSWTITLDNSGDGEARNVVATDTLPTNWTYVAQTSIKRNGATASGVTFASGPTWTVDSMAPGDEIVIVYTAKPTVAAYTTPGVGDGTTHPSTNSVAITAEDTSGATGNGDGSYAGPPARADAYLVATDIAITKSLVTVTPQINVGDVIEFALTVTNNGEQPADGVEVTDALPAGLTFTGLTGGATPYGSTTGWTCDSDADTIAANAADCTFDSAIPAGESREVHVFALVQAIPGAASTRSITNTADVTMTTPEDPSKLDDNEDSTTITAHAPLISLVKTGELAAGATGVPGDLITYTFTATNLDLGATLQDVTITDPLLTPSTVDIPAGAWPGAVGILGPGESVTTTATYAITQADLDAGLVTNLAEVDATDPLGDPVVDTDGVTVPLPSTPSIELVKDGSLDAGTSNRAGDGVTWTFLVTNTGNVTLSSVGIADGLAGLSAITFASTFTGTLAPGESVTATATSSLTQADVDAGKVDNTATASGTPATGGTPVTDTDPAKVTITANPSVVLVKTSAFAPGGQLRKGDKVIYTFTATNTGNVSLTSLDITDDMPGLAKPVFTAWPSTDGVLRPGETVTTTAEYTMTQADVDAGSLTNHAIVVATPPSGPTITTGSTTTITIDPHPAVTLVKTAAFAKGASGVVGDTIVFSFLATNTGNVTLTEAQIEDAKPGLGAIVYGTWPATPGQLGPGESVTATADYTLTAADVLAGVVTNTAKISAVGLVKGVSTAVTADSSVKIEVPTGLATAGGNKSPSLASTGLELGPWLLGMVLLIAAGSALMLVGRRKRRRHVG